MSGKDVSEIKDKSKNNNSTALRSYYNLYKGTEVCTKSVDDPLFAIRNFVLKFQFPNNRTFDSFKDCMDEGTLLAPFRVIIGLLYHMAQINPHGESSLTYNEILYFIFCNPIVFKNPKIDYAELSNNIIKSRSQSLNLERMIASTIEWNQYVRQIGELMAALFYASKAFKKGNRSVFFSLSSTGFIEDKDYIDTILNYNFLWYPSNKNNFNLASKEYISYMDTVHTPYTVVDINNMKPEKPHKADNDDSLQYNLIYFGAPGTGKSFKLKEDIDGCKQIRTIFHPDSDYSSFVGCYKPHDDGARIKYEFRPQAFIDAYVNAWLTTDPFYLVIEEINRGNCAQIFGDIFQLLDRTNGISDYKITPDDDLQGYLAKTFASKKDDSGITNKRTDIPQDIENGTTMYLPNNLFFRATMNTSDQSLFPMDSAFKRRWSWKFFSIKDEGKGFKIKVNDENDEYDWWKTINALNEKILATTKSADKQLGYWFAKLPEGETIISADQFVSKVIFYLWNDVFKDYNFGDNNPFTPETTFDKFFDSDGEIIEDTIVAFMKRNYPKDVTTEENPASDEAAN